MQKRLTVLSLFALSSMGCWGYSPCDGPKTELAGGLQSHSSPASVRESLPGCEWDVIEQPEPHPQDQRPRFDVLTVDLGLCAKVDEDARAEIQFLNDRLLAVYLYTPDAQGRFQELHEQQGWEDAEDSSLLRPPQTRVRWAIDRRGEAYIAYEDTCLVHELETWIKTFA